MIRKVKITIACWATVVATAIVISLIFVLFGMKDKIELFFYLHFSVGAIVIFFFFGLSIQKESNELSDLNGARLDNWIFQVNEQ